MSSPTSSPTSSPRPSPSPSQPSASSAASQPVSPDPYDNEVAFPVRAPPPLKRRRLDVPVREARARKAAKVREKRKQALRAMKRLLSSKKPFQGGPNGLLSYRMRAIQACLHMVVEDKMGLMAASRVAAKANLFSEKWGARQVRHWTQQYVKTRALPRSRRGLHAKAFSIFNDPAVRAAICGYMRSNKWSLNPVKLRQLMKNELERDEATAYAQEIVSQEMPRGLKKYVEEVVLPRMHLKARGKGYSLAAMRRLMLREGFAYWHLEGEFRLKPKGVGRGLHQSDFICSTVGWLKDASQTLEYGKNYEGYWNGELFVKQLKERFFRAFEEAHGPGYTAVVLVDNSQGHSAYAADALRASRMNLRPGGKQARMRDGWFMRDGMKVCQPMIFPANHKQYPNQPKGMKQRWLREHCDYTFDTLRENMPKALASVSVELIRKWEHRAWRFIDAYRDGLDAKEAQKRVKEFSSRRYKSHRRVGEALGRTMDVQ
ncbi:hypothetical protein EV715DRAFT_214853 [Schizophyllum commune]